VQDSSPSPKYVAILALIACVILVGGWLVRPRDIPQSPAHVPSQTELEQLARRSERRSLESTAKYFADVARDAESSVWFVSESGTSAVALDSARAVTATMPRAIESANLLTAAGHSNATTDIWDPGLPVTSLTLSTGRSVFAAHRAEGLPAAGDWVVAVWRTDQGSLAFAHGTFQQVHRARCGVTPVTELRANVVLTRPMLGGGIFNIDGGLIAIIVACDERVAAVDVASVQSILERAGGLPERLLGRYGVAVAPLSEDERALFKAPGGLLVREVRIGSPADASGLTPGDIISALGEQPVSGIDDLKPLAGTSGGAELTVLRGKGSVKLVLSPSAQMPGAAGESWPKAPSIAPLGVVAPDSRAGQAGLQRGDRIVTIDREPPRNLSQVERLLGAAQRRPALLEVERGAWRVLVVAK